MTCTEFGLGASVAAGDDVVVVGVPDYRLPGPLSRGAAHVFRRSGVDWLIEATLIPSDATHGGAGTSVAIDGDTIVVGDPAATIGGAFGAGAAYVFHRDGLDWEEAQKLTASDAFVGDQFGWSVSISGDRIVVGAIDDDDLGDSSGAAYVFQRTPSGWIEANKLLASDGRWSARFGHAVSVESDVVLVGQVEQGPPPDRPGSAYVFRWDGAIWVEEARLRGTDVESSQFGYSVSLECDRALVGAPNWRSGGTAQGAAYLFEHGPAGWSLVESIQECSQEDLYAYGAAVAVGPDTALVGATGDDVAGVDAGAAFALALDPICGCATCADVMATITSASIDSEGVRRSLRGKALAACRAFDRGQSIAAGNVLCAIIHECNAQDGKHIAAASADDIRACVRSVAAALDIPFERCGRGVPPRADPRGRR